jgi:hypothetical protein
LRNAGGAHAQSISDYAAIGTERACEQIGIRAGEATAGVNTSQIYPTHIIVRRVSQLA